jgi:hypothetical protein
MGETKKPSFPRNVNMYRHLLTRDSTAADVEWSIGLRLPQLPGRRRASDGPGPPSVYTRFEEKIKSRRRRLNSAEDPDARRGDFTHTYKNRTRRHPNQSQFNFETNLRTYEGSRGRTWVSSPRANGAMRTTGSLNSSIERETWEPASKFDDRLSYK